MKTSVRITMMPPSIGARRARRSRRLDCTDLPRHQSVANHLGAGTARHHAAEGRVEAERGRAACGEARTKADLCEAGGDLQSKAHTYRTHRAGSRSCETGDPIWTGQVA